MHASDGVCESLIPGVQACRKSAFVISTRSALTLRESEADYSIFVGKLFSVPRIVTISGSSTDDSAQVI